MMSYSYDQLGWVREVTFRKTKNFHCNYLNKIWNSSSDTHVITYNKPAMFYGKYDKNDMFISNDIDKHIVVKRSIEDSLKSKKWLYVIKQNNNNYRQVRLLGKSRVYGNRCRNPEMFDINGLFLYLNIQSSVYFLDNYF